MRDKICTIRHCISDGQGLSNVRSFHKLTNLSKGCCTISLHGPTEVCNGKVFKLYENVVFLLILEMEMFTGASPRGGNE